MRAGRQRRRCIDARFVISAVGSLNLPQVPDIPGMDTFAGPSFHSARWPDDLDIAGTRFALDRRRRERVPDRARRSRTRSTQLTIYQRTAQWMFPNPVYRATVPAGDRWALRHLPFYARWFRFMMTYPGIAIGTAPYRVDPDYDDADGDRRSTRRNAGAAARSRRGSARSSTDGPTSSRSRSPTIRRWASGSCRTTATGCVRCASPNVELVRTGIERIVPEGVVTVDGTLRAADVICYATGFRHNEFLAPMEVTGRDGIVAARAVGGRADRVPRRHDAQLPQPVLPVRAGDEPGAQLEPLLPLRVPGEPRDGGDPPDAPSGARAMRGAPRRARRVRRVAPGEISQLVWAHPSIAHSHYKNPAGKVFTLSPWPIDQYREWTRRVHGDEYVFG